MDRDSSTIKILTPRQIEWARQKRREGRTLSEIANALYVSRFTIYRATYGVEPDREPLHYDFREDEE